VRVGVELTPSSWGVPVTATGSATLRALHRLLTSVPASGEIWVTADRGGVRGPADARGPSRRRLVEVREVVRPGYVEETSE
jgi:hypothetical protein